jgi:hypothetical protein
VTHISAQRWQKRRSEFNHDWLKNQYIPALAKCRNLLDGRVEDPEFEAVFLLRIFPQWEHRRATLVELIGLYEQMMSPQTLLEELPLSAMREGDKRWLGPLVHSLWLARTPAMQLVRSAHEAFARVDASYERLKDSVSGADSSALFLSPFREQFLAFRDDLQLLANAISDLPRDIDVT